MGLFTKTVTVEQIHEEFDSAQERILLKAKEIIKNSSDDENLIRKSKMLSELGFVNSETAVKGEKIVEKIEISEKVASHINRLKFEYPLDKFITVDELDRICNKYGLIHAPVINYIKDVPEKNVLEMKNSKRLSSEHAAVDRRMFRYTGSFNSNATREQKKLFKSGIDITDMPNYDSDFWIDNNDISNWAFGERLCAYDNIDKSIDTIKRGGLFIAAPKTHFDLRGLKKATKFGFFGYSTQEIKDPVVFEYCKNDIIRIVTKWGTDDDQSYLDEGLINEILN